MTTPRIDMFYGDGRNSENPQDFIKMLETSFDHDTTLTGVQKCERFRRNCRSTMDAEDWYDEQDTTTTCTDWDKLKTAFNLRWPPQQRIKPTQADRTKELRNTLLLETDILSKVERGGVLVYGFVAWMAEISRLAARCDTANAHVQTVYETTPRVLRDLVPETTLTTWATFAAAVLAVSITKLRDAVEEESRKKVIENQIAELNRRSRAPPPAQPSNASMDELRRMLGGMSLSAPSPTRNYTPPPQVAATPAAAAPNMRGSRLYASFPQPPAAAAPAPYVPAPARSYTYRPAQERLVDLQRTALPQHPDTPAGQIAYALQLTTYANVNGTLRPHETRPFPLRPGTLPANTGACFRCGTDAPRRHTQRECTSTAPVPELELRYRMIASVCHGLIRGPQAPEGFVAQAVRMIEVTNLTDAQLEEMQASGAVITEVDQGNGNGLLA